MALRGADDLRWILRLTSAKVESSMAARHRQLGLDDPRLVDRAHAVITGALSGGDHRTRPQLAALLGEHGLPNSGEQVGHLLLLAELRALICSGPMRANVHTYGLVDELIAPSAELDRDDAVRRLALRFFRGHGPAWVSDLVRWTTVTKREVTAAVADLGDALRSIEVDGTPVWFDADAERPEVEQVRPFLLPVFDEVYLTYPRLNFPRLGGHPRGEQPHSFGEAGGGVVVVDRHDAGRWKRTHAGTDRVVVTIAAGGLDSPQGDAVLIAAERLAGFTGRRLELVEP